MAQSSVNLTTSILAFIDSEFVVVRFLCVSKNFCYNLAKALQDLCNLHQVVGSYYQPVVNSPWEN